MEGDFLSEDFCVLEGRDFLVRAVLAIPVIGLQGDFGFGCWTSLSRANFAKYVDGFDTGEHGGEHGEEGPWSGWLCNRLTGFIEQPTAVWVEPRLGGQRPLLWIQQDGHPLAVAQKHGVTAARMLELLAAYGHAPD